MDISKINVNGTSYNIVDTVTSINGKTGAIEASDINAVLSAAGYDISGNTGYTAGTGISISEQNAISITYGNTSGTACQGNDSRLSDSRPASDVSSWAKADTKPPYTLDEVLDGTSRKIPTKVSDLTNDSGYLTSHQSLSGYATEAWVGQQGYLTSHQSLSGYATESWVSSKFNDVLGIDASGVSDLVSILSDNDTATGILNVIASKANASSIPTKVSDLTNDTGFITSYTNTVTSINGKTGEIAAADMATVLTAAGYALTDTNTWPTALSQLSNDVGYITGITSSMVTTALGYTPPTTDTNTWRPITNTYTGPDEGTSLSQYGANALYNALVNGYASSAGNADTLDNIDSSGFFRNFGVNGFIDCSSMNAQGITTIDGYSQGPDSSANVTVLNLGEYSSARFKQLLFNYENDNIYYRRKAGDAPWTSWVSLITSSNIGSQSVNYATTAGSAPANGGNSSTVNGHTVNSDVPAGAVFTDTNTWRPLGTGADDACAGNDSRLSDSRPSSDVYSWAKASSKPSYAYSEIDYTVNAVTTSGAISLDGSTYPLHVVTLNGNASSVALSANPAAGHSCHVIFACGATSYTVAIAHDSTNRICPEATDLSFTVPANGYVEVDFLNANSKIYVRGV